VRYRLFAHELQWQCRGEQSIKERAHRKRPEQMDESIYCSVAKPTMSRAMATVPQDCGLGIAKS
jgi:hypothetical protein